MVSQSDKIADNKPKKQFVALKAIANILYVISAIILVYSVINIIINVMDGINFSPNFDPDNFDMPSGGMNVANAIFNGARTIIISVVLFIIATVLMTIYRKKNKNTIIEETTESPATKYKKMFRDIVNVVTDATDSDNNQEQKKEEKVHIFCAYCGSELDEKDRKCPSCGASKKIRKKPEQTKTE